MLCGCARGLFRSHRAMPFQLWRASYCHEKEVNLVDEEERALDALAQKAGRDDPRSALHLGVMLCESASRLYELEMQKYSQNIIVDQSGRVDYADTLPQEEIQKISSKAEFLRWVRKEKNRLLTRQSAGTAQDMSDTMKLATQRLGEAYYWFYQSAMGSEPMGMYVMGSLLFDRLLHADLFQQLCQSPSARDVHAISFPDHSAMNSTQQLACQQAGYRWIWAAALGDLSIAQKETVEGLPPSEESWNVHPKEKQSGLAWYDLGVIHYRGASNMDLAPSPPLSYSLFSVAAQRHQVADAYFWMGFQRWEHDWSSIPVDQRLQHPAIVAMMEGARLGNGEAMFFLSVAYFDGTLPAQDPVQEAVRWMERACDARCRRALHAMGDWHVQGPQQPPFFPTNYSHAFRYYERATQTEAGCYDLAPEEASQSFCSLGVLHLQGLGTMKDERKAFENYQKAAELGNAQACFNLADMLKNGIGVGKNPKSALRYEQLGEKLAQSNLNHD